jgi:hypothetical protein
VETIIKDIEDVGFTQAGNKYGVSCQAVRKWLVLYEKQDKDVAVLIREFRKKYATSRRTLSKVQIPSIEQLIDDLEALGYTGTGMKYNVSGSAVRSWLKRYEKQDDETSNVVCKFRDRWTSHLKLSTKSNAMQVRPMPDNMTAKILEEKIEKNGIEKTVKEFHTSHKVLKRWLSIPDNSK